MKEHRPVGVQARSNAIRITISSDPTQICVARKAAETFAERQRFDGEAVSQIGLALNEALANVIRHGYGGDTKQTIDVTMEVIEEQRRCGIKIVVRDTGRQVDPQRIKGRDLDDVRPGGLGVHIIKTVMDTVEYRCLPEGGMELTMIKFMSQT